MEEKNKKQSADQVVKEIKRRTRRTFTAEEKIKIVLRHKYQLTDPPKDSVTKDSFKIVPKCLHGQLW